MIPAIFQLRFCALLAVVIGLTACSADAPLKGPLTYVKNIQLPRDKTTPALDLLAMDPRNGLLYVPHSSNDSLDVIDTHTESVVGSVANLAGVKAVTLSADPKHVFTSNASDGSVALVDTAALKIISTVKVGGSPDAISYDPVDKLVVVSLGSDKNLSFIDEGTMTVKGKLSLPGKPELMAVDTLTGRIYLAINDKDEVVFIDPVARTILKTYKGCDIRNPTGLALDPEQGRLFVANAVPRQANVMSIVDVVIDRCLGSVDIDHGADQAAFNPQRHHIYVANAGSNNLSVIDSVTLKPLGVVGTGKEAATLAADATTNRVYVAAARSGLVAIYTDP